MAFDLGSVIAHIKADTTEFSKGIGSAKNLIGSFKNSVAEASNTAFKLSAALSGVAAVGTIAFLKSASAEANNFEKAMITLEIVAGRFGQSADEAKKQAEILGKELRIGVGPAAESLQNLLKNGLNLEQASGLLRRFTNEAMTGKSANISLSEAVQNLSFAYATGNSALGNMSGISENWINIIDNGKDVLSKWNGKVNEGAGITQELADQITNYEKQLKAQGKTLEKDNDEQAKYIGLLKLTNLTMGSSEKFAGTLIDTQAELAIKIMDVKVAIGKELNPILNELLKNFTKILPTAEQVKNTIGAIRNVIVGFIEAVKTDDAGALFDAINALVPDDAKAEAITNFLGRVAGLMRDFGNWVVENKETIISFLQGLAIAFGALSIIGGVVALVTALANPLVWLTGLIALLYTAWAQNWGDIQGKTKAVITYLQDLFEKHKEELQAIWDAVVNLVKIAAAIILHLWQSYGQSIINVVQGAFNVVMGVIRIILGTITGIINAFVALVTGDWEGFWNALRVMAKTNLDAVQQIFSGAIQAIVGIIQGLFPKFKEEFEKVWKFAKDIANKIRESIASAFDVKKRNSPSIMDRLGTIVSSARTALSSITVPNFSHQIAHSLGGISAPSYAGGLGGGLILNIDLSGALISDEASARRISEMVGDNIVKNLQKNVRF